MQIRQMRLDDVPGAVALQRACFPAPFPEDLLWNSVHLRSHLEIFPQGQFVALSNDQVVGSCSNTQISEQSWLQHKSWHETVGGPFLDSFDPEGSTLYGLDISVHPEYRRLGIGRSLYAARFELVRSLGLTRYGTGCRLPDCRRWMASHPGRCVESYCMEVVAERQVDRTLSPLLRYGLRFLDVIHGYMEDVESANAAALLEWQP